MDFGNSYNSNAYPPQQGGRMLAEEGSPQYQQDYLPQHSPSAHDQQQYPAAAAMSSGMSINTMNTMRAPDFQPIKLINLAEISTREKEKYYRLLLLNQAKFRYDATTGKYIANIRMLAPGVRKTTDEVVAAKKKAKDKQTNFALIFQERLVKLRQEGFISVLLQGNDPKLPEFQYQSYPRFVGLIAFNQELVRPKLRPLSWVMRQLEDLYDQRFAHERHDIERQYDDDNSSFDLILLIFPVFVVRRLGTNIGLKSLVDQTCWDLLFSIDVYRRDYLEVETFGRFLQEFYDHDDLLFYLYVRSVISKVLHVQFKSRWTKFDGPGRQPKSLWMTYREAAHVAKIVFGADNEEMYREFMTLVTPQMVGSKSDTADSRRIDITEYLHLSVIGYHQSQSRNNQGNERFLVPLPGQVVPTAPVPLPPSAMSANYQQQHEVEEREAEMEAPETEEFYPQPAVQQSTKTSYSARRNNRDLARPVAEDGNDLAAAYDMQNDFNDLEQEFDPNFYGEGPPETFQQPAMGNNDYYYDVAPNAYQDQQPVADEYIPQQDDMNNYHMNNNDYMMQMDNNFASQPGQFDAGMLDTNMEDFNNNYEYNNGGADNNNNMFMNDAVEEGFGDDAMMYNNDDYNNAMPQQSNEEGDVYDDNAFEELQLGREQEFMSQLLAPLESLPPEITSFADQELRDRLHQTVHAFLADKQITDLEILDNALIEILSLEELRADMEALRDEIVQGLMS